MFKLFDLVHIKKDLPKSMSHFEKDKDAIILEVSRGGGCGTAYDVFIKGRGECAWYYDDNLVLIEHDKRDLLREWKKAMAVREKRRSSLTWIFENGRKVYDNGYSASIITLAKRLGYTSDDLWGSHGEAMTFYVRGRKVLELAKPFLLTGDKDMFLKFCEDYKNRKEIVAY